MFDGGDDFAVQVQAAAAYEVVERVGAVEIRRYRRALIAEVSLASPSAESLTMAVDCFARYIFGPTRADERGDLLSQTALSPHQRGRGDWRLRFFIASEVAPEDYPAPSSDSLRLLLEPERLVAALGHEPKASGRMVHAARRQLQETIRATRRYELDDRSEWAAYDAPFVVPFGTRPETLIELREASLSEASVIWGLMTNAAPRPRVDSGTYAPRA